MLRALYEHWFLTEPAFFALYCQQQLEENVRMECPVRCGQGRIEYNPLLLKHKNFKEVEQLMRIEMIRLFLKHPYEREPEGCCREAMSIGSNITIADGYCLLHKEKLPLQDPGFYHLPLGQYYEWYAKQIQGQMEEDKENSKQRKDNERETEHEQGQGNGSSSDNQQQDNDPLNEQSESNKSLSALWREDSLRRQQINDLIDRTNDWGSIPGEIVERIKASTQAKINNRLIWQGFKSTILNSQRKLTRIKPNRRTGFLQMGNTRQFTTRVLVAIDVSGSITTEILADFYSAVNRLFRYGIAEIDICQFDAELGPIIPMHRASREVEVCGRGGTSYQPLFDFMAGNHKYDGLIILTDGEAEPPHLPHHDNAVNLSTSPRLCPILWVCHNRESYERSKAWMLHTGRCCYL